MNGAILWGLAGVALLGVVINQICFAVGLSYTTPGYSALINVTIPVTALVFAWVLRFERPDLMRGCGVAVAAGGLALMLTAQLQADWRTGNLITFVNALSFGCFLVVSRPLYRRVHPYAGTAVIFAFGSLGIVAAVGWRIPMVDWLALPWWVWGRDGLHHPRGDGGHVRAQRVRAAPRRLLGRGLFHLPPAADRDGCLGARRE